MDITFEAFLSALGLFEGMLLCLKQGRRIGRCDMQRDPEGEIKGLAAIEGAVFGLLDLLIAFAFSGAATHRAGTPVQATMLLINALNSMIDISTTRVVAT